MVGHFCDDFPDINDEMLDQEYVDVDDVDELEELAQVDDEGT